MKTLQFILFMVTINMLSAQTAQELLDQVVSKYNKVNDYSASILVRADVPMIKTLPVRATIYFKQKDKFRIVSKSIAILPKKGFTDVNVFLADPTQYMVVDAGSKSISGVEARLLTVQAWDKGQIAAIEKAIQASPLGLQPANDGVVIRIPMPELSEERRREYVKLIGKLAEDSRVSIRNIRRTEMETIKKEQKDGDIPEDDARKLTDQLQKLTDSYIAKIDEAFKAKEADIMAI